MILVFVTIIILIGIMSVNFKVRIDLTKDDRYTLSSQTVKILKSLDNDVDVIAFYRSDERTRQAMLDLLKEYSYYSPKFNFRFVDPDKKPSRSGRTRYYVLPHYSFELRQQTGSHWHRVGESTN